MDYNALIRQNSGDSLSIIARILVADLKDFPADWKIRYCAKDIDRETTNIRDLCCCAQNPLQIYKPAEAEEFPVTVRTMGGKSLQVLVTAQNTVQMLKLKIFQLDQSFPPCDQKLYFGNHDKSSNRHAKYERLDRVGISTGSIIYIKSTFSMENVKNKPNVGTSSIVSYNWNQLRLTAGISFYGVCPNPQCPSAGSSIRLRSLPYGEIRLNLATRSSQLDCPRCSTNNSAEEDLTSPAIFENPNFQIIPNGFIAFHTRYTIFAKREGEDRVRKIWSNEIKGMNIENIKWNFGSSDILEITAVEPWRVPSSCVICDTLITFKTQGIQKQCGHFYHYWCLPSIIQHRTCKACDAKPLIVSKMEDVFKVL